MHRLLVSSVLVAGVFAGTATAAEWGADVGAWSIRTDLSSHGTPVCFAQLEPRPDARVTAARTTEEFILVLRDAEWELEASDTMVDLQVGGAFLAQHRASVDSDALVVRWPADAKTATALRTAASLTLTLPGGTSHHWFLDDATAAMASLGACIAEQVTAHAKDGSDPGPLTAMTAHALARDFETWLRTALAKEQLTIAPPTTPGGSFALRAGDASGSIHLLSGGTHEAVLADGARVAAATCPDQAPLAERVQYEIDGLVLEHATLQCEAQDLALVVVSFANDPGGLALVFESAPDETTGGHLAARVINDMLRPEPSSRHAQAHVGR